MTNDICLDILGTSFTITADEDKKYLDKVLTQYKAAVKNTQEISGIKEPINIAILTGFLLCDEINKIKQEIEKNKTSAIEKEEEFQVQERTLRLIAKLDNALNECIIQEPDDE